MCPMWSAAIWSSFPARSPLAPDGLKYVGKLGADMSLEDGKAAARLCAINLLAQLKAACGGDLDRVRALREAGRVRQRHARFHPASGSRPMAPPT